MSMESYLFHRGESYESYRYFGCHMNPDDSVRFAVYAPNAKAVYVTGDFDAWNGNQHPLKKVTPNGIYEIVLPPGLVKPGGIYKYRIVDQLNQVHLKSDPYAFQSEFRPRTASIATKLDHYNWKDARWISQRKRKNHLKNPLNIYELHLGSFMRRPDGHFNTYTQLADLVIPYVLQQGYTHIELLPLMEHPLDASWGYQVTGYFSATSRYGSPDELKYFIDQCHQNNIGVIMDWVPCHFCKDAHGLYHFDGSNVYESAYHFVADNEQWGTANFDFSRKEVISFLISNAIFWFDQYHIDGLRVDAVAFILYLDYGRKPGSLKNEYGGNENLWAIDFIKKLNREVHTRFPGVLTIAEESTAWPHVTWPDFDGGLGFNYKWNMGWMNDTLKYFAMDYTQRHRHHQLLTFSLMYAFSENFILPFSHDEVVHGKKSLIGRMPGDYWQKFANTRLLMAYMMTHPGKKLNFMGNELAHFIEWDENRELDWFLLEYESHASFNHYSQALNALYLNEPALYEVDDSFDGFSWIDCDNNSQSILSFERLGKLRKNDLIIILNFTPTTYDHFKIGVSKKRNYIELFNSDERIYGGSGIVNADSLTPQPSPLHGRPYSLSLKIPPLGIVILKSINEVIQ